MRDPARDAAIGGELGGDRGQRGHRAAQLLAAEHELADEVEQAIELVEVDADRLPAIAVRGRRGVAPPGAASATGCTGAAGWARFGSRSRATTGAGSNGDRLPRARGLQHRAQTVERGEQRVGHRAVDRAPGVADLADEVLRGVRELVHRREADHRRASLDGMEVAEHVAQQLAVAGVALDLDELAGQRLAALVGLVEEQLDHVLVDRGVQWKPTLPGSAPCSGAASATAVAGGGPASAGSIAPPAAATTASTAARRSSIGSPSTRAPDLSGLACCATAAPRVPIADDTTGRASGGEPARGDVVEHALDRERERGDVGGADQQARQPEPERDVGEAADLERVAAADRFGILERAEAVGIADRSGDVAIPQRHGPHPPPVEDVPASSRWWRTSQPAWAPGRVAVMRTPTPAARAAAITRRSTGARPSSSSSAPSRSIARVARSWRASRAESCAETSSGSGWPCSITTSRAGTLGLGATTTAAGTTGRGRLGVTVAATTGMNGEVSARRGRRT